MLAATRIFAHMHGEKYKYTENELKQTNYNDCEVLLVLWSTFYQKILDCWSEKDN